MPPLEFRIAREPWELEQIHRLNYRTFTEEIPQHPVNEERVRVDKFHERNTYVVCAEGRRIVGMAAVTGERPFSVESKIDGFDAYIPAGRRLLEIRLLAVEPDRRLGPILDGLVRELWRFGTERGYDAAVISATTRQLPLYEHLGFVPFGPRVGSAEARFQPMLLTREALARNAPRVGDSKISAEKACFLPGPVTVHRDVAAAFARPPVSHRAAEFREAMEETRAALRRLTGARHAEVVVGSGTVANEMVAAQIARWREPGLVLANGEFGERLIDHARRMKLAFDVLQVEWGDPLDPSALDLRRARWVWMTACETSTALLNPWEEIADLCRARGARFCLDAVSAVGSVPVDLSAVDLATAVSGKGLGAYPGLGIVFHRDPIAPDDSIPRALDLGLWAEQGSAPFTHSSNLVGALRTAVAREGWEERFRERAAIAAWLRARLTEMGLELVGRGVAAPQVITFAPRGDASSIAEALARDGFTIAWESAYLRRRNWMQIGLMGEITRRDAAALARAMRRASSRA